MRTHSKISGAMLPVFLMAGAGPGFLPTRPPTRYRMTSSRTLDPDDNLVKVGTVTDELDKPDTVFTTSLVISY